nr:hypothetical protein [Tanacetum cinerariifolium]
MPSGTTALTKHVVKVRHVIWMYKIQDVVWRVEKILISKIWWEVVADAQIREVVVRHVVVEEDLKDPVANYPRLTYRGHEVRHVIWMYKIQDVVWRVEKILISKIWWEVVADAQIRKVVVRHVVVEEDLKDPVGNYPWLTYRGHEAVKGNPLATNVGDSALDTTARGHANAHVYVGGQPLKSILKTNRTKDGVSNVVRDVPAANVGIENNIKEGIGGIPGTSCMDSPKLQDGAGVSNHDTVLPKAAKERVMSRYANTLVGYLLLMKTDNNLFLFKFYTKKGMDQVLKRGPWLIHNTPLIFNKWAPNASLKPGEVSNHDTVLPKAAKERVMSRYANTLVGYLLLMKTDNNLFLFKFYTKKGMDQVLKRGPWLIHNTPLIFNKWAPNASLKPGEVNKVSVWVKLYNVPVVAYFKDGLSLIATQVRKPIMLDAFTSPMCVDSWGRISFARALIEIHADSDLKKEVRMAIPIDDDDETSVVEPIVDASINDGFTKVEKKSNGSKSGSNSTSNIGTKKGGDKATRVQSDLNTAVSNTFDVLNEVDEIAYDPKVSEHVGSGSSKVGEDKTQEEESLWSHFQRSKKDSQSKDYLDDDSEVEEYPPYDAIGISSIGGGFSLEDDALDCYEAQVFNLSGKSQAFCDNYDIRLNSHVRK